MSTTTTRRPVREDSDHHDVRNAWLSMLLLPVAFVGAFVVGEGLATLLGHPVGATEDPPLWSILVASVLGIGFYAAVALAERLTMGWHPSARAGRAE